MRNQEKHQEREHGGNEDQRLDAEEDRATDLAERQALHDLQDERREAEVARHDAARDRVDAAPVGRHAVREQVHVRPLVRHRLALVEFVVGERVLGFVPVVQGEQMRPADDHAAEDLARQVVVDAG